MNYKSVLEEQIRELQSHHRLLKEGGVNPARVPEPDQGEAEEVSIIIITERR